MNWLDGIILIELGFSALWGLKRGLVKTILPLVGLIAGVFLAGQYYVSVAEWLFDSPGGAAKAAAFSIVVGAVVLLASVLAKLVAGVLSLLLLGWADRLGGGLFGLSIGVVVAGAVLALMAKFPLIGLDRVIMDSSLASVLLERFPLILSLLPEEFDSVRSFFE